MIGEVYFTICIIVIIASIVILLADKNQKPKAKKEVSIPEKKDAPVPDPVEAEPKPQKNFASYVPFIVIGIVVLLVISIIVPDKEDDSTTAVVSENIPSEAEETDPAETEATQEETQSDDSELSEEAAVSIFCALLHDKAQEGYGDNYKIEKDTENRLIILSVWTPGLTFSSALANLDEQQKKDYNELKESTVTASKSIKDEMDECGLNNWHITINVLNDLNTDNVIIATFDGTLFYDAFDNTLTSNKPNTI